MAKTINLDMTSVDNREMRLGSIIAWDGSASELVEQSNYEARSQRTGYDGRKGTGGCAGKGEGCKLCELNTPFSQQTMCTNSIVHCQIGNLTDCVLIDHAPIGCSSNSYRYDLGFKMGLLARHKPLQSVTITSTNLLENDMVFGAGNKLEQTIRDVKERYDPKAIFISMACSTAIIGEDIDSVAQNMEEEIGVPVIPLHCEGFRSKHWSTGFDISQHGILRQIVNKKPKKQKDLINIIALWGTDYFTDMLKPLGLRVNYMVDMASFDELKQASEAVATATFCHTLSQYMATALEQNFGIPQVEAPQPYGISATDEWYRAIAKIVGKEDIVEEFIESEHKRIEPELKRLRKKLKGLKGCILTGSSYAHAMICALKDIGIEVEGSVVFHHDPVYDGGLEFQNTLKYMVDNYGDVKHFTVSKTQPYQLYNIFNRIDADFVIIRHQGLAPTAARIGKPSLALGDEHLPLGYDGLIRLGNMILAVVARKKFNHLLTRHIELPYTDWWLSQEDPFLLSHHPEVLDDVFGENAENPEEETT